MDFKQIAIRLMQIIISILGVSIITFSLIYLSPGDPAELYLLVGGTKPSKELVEQTRIDMGLDKPYVEQYVSWLGKAIKGDLGISYASKLPVTEVLISNMKSTIQLATSSLVLMLIISIPLGVLCAVYKSRFTDLIIRGTSFLGISMPNFWVGLILLYIFGLKLGWLPIADSGAGIKKMILPCITLAFSMASKYTRQIRALMLEEMKQDYVIVNRARGLKESTILWRHVLPNAFLPLIILVGLSFGSLLGGTAVVEIIFSWPGLGKMAVTAINNRNYPMVQGYVLFISLTYMIINLMVDIINMNLDPRLKKR